MTTLFIGQNHIKLSEVDSTNDYASILIKNDFLPEGTVVSAYSQLKGKGQRSKQWLSEPGSNLILSIILRPDFLSAERQFELNKAIAVGIATFISGFITSKKVSIKWPNDIYIGNNKVAGILIENNLRNNTIQSSIIGIGCNINQTTFDETIPNATSLKIETQQDYSISTLTENICSFIEAKYLELRNNNASAINNAYNNLLYRKGEIIDFKKNEGTILRGTLKEVNPKGLLILVNSDGEDVSLSNADGSILVITP